MQHKEESFADKYKDYDGFGYSKTYVNNYCLIETFSDEPGRNYLNEIAVPYIHIELDGTATFPAAEDEPAGLFEAYAQKHADNFNNFCSPMPRLSYAQVIERIDAVCPTRRWMRNIRQEVH